MRKLSIRLALPLPLPGRVSLLGGVAVVFVQLAIRECGM